MLLLKKASLTTRLFQLLKSQLGMATTLDIDKRVDAGMMFVCRFCLLDYCQHSKLLNAFYREVVDNITKTMKEWPAFWLI